MKSLKQKMAYLLLMVLCVVLVVGCSTNQGSDQAASEGEKKDNYPEKPLSLIIPFDPGGGADSTLIPIKQMLADSFGQNVLFSYKPGAGGQIGWETAFNEESDGYTMAYMALPHFLNTILEQDARYKVEDFEPVCIFVEERPLYFTYKDAPWNDLNDMINYAKENPEKLSIAIGSATGEHFLSLKIIEDKAGVKFRITPVDGGGKVNSNILGKHFDIGVSNPSAVTSIKDEIKVLGYLGPERSQMFPECKTFEEQLSFEVPYLARFRGIMVRKEVKADYPERYNKLVETFNQAVNSDACKEALAKASLEVKYQGPEQAMKTVQDQKTLMEENAYYYNK